MVAASLDVKFDYERDRRRSLHPGRTAKVVCNGEEVGYLGQVLYEICDELDMRVPAYVAEIDLRDWQVLRQGEKVHPALPQVPGERSVNFCFVMDKGIPVLRSRRRSRIRMNISPRSSFSISMKASARTQQEEHLAYSVVFTPRDDEFKPEVIDGFVSTILSNLGEKFGITLRA